MYKDHPNYKNNSAKVEIGVNGILSTKIWMKIKKNVTNQCLYFGVP